MQVLAGAGEAGGVAVRLADDAGAVGGLEAWRVELVALLAVLELELELVAEAQQLLVEQLGAVGGLVERLVELVLVPVGAVEPVAMRLEGDNLRYEGQFCGLSTQGDFSVHVILTLCEIITRMRDRRRCLGLGLGLAPAVGKTTIGAPSSDILRPFDAVSNFLSF